MLYYGRIGINKTSRSKEWDICHYLHFLDKGCKVQLYLCNVCHDLLQMPMNLGNITILNINGADYHCIINRISKNEAIKIMRNIKLNKKTKL